MLENLWACQFHIHYEQTQQVSYMVKRRYESINCTGLTLIDNCLNMIMESVLTSFISHPKLCKTMKITREIFWCKPEMLQAYLPTFHQFILSLQFCTHLTPPEYSMVLLCIDKYGLFCCRFNRQWYPRVCCNINLGMNLHDNI